MKNHNHKHIYYIQWVRGNWIIYEAGIMQHMQL